MTNKVRAGRGYETTWQIQAFMAEDYTVQGGDCMSSIAYEHGFFWKTLWNLPENDALKAKRKNPNVLMTGDIVHIPDLTVRNEPGATEKTHKFVLKGVPEKLHITLLDSDHKPRRNMAYKMVIDGKWRSGTTDGDGKITENIPPNAKTGQLIFPSPQSAASVGGSKPAKPQNQVISLQLGALNPVSNTSGAKARLANLGFYKGPIDENLDGPTKNAIRAFQAKKGLPQTGNLDDATTAQLQQLHGH